MTIYVDGQRIYDVEWKACKVGLRYMLREWCKDNSCPMGGVELWCGEWLRP